MRHLITALLLGMIFTLPGCICSYEVTYFASVQSPTMNTRVDVEYTDEGGTHYEYNVSIPWQKTVTFIEVWDTTEEEDNYTYDSTYEESTYASLIVRTHDSVSVTTDAAISVDGEIEEQESEAGIYSYIYLSHWIY
jgi:hypothetical protein